MITFGNNEFGQSGNGKLESKIAELPKPVKALIGNKIVKVSCGLDHNVVLTNKGDVWIWGIGEGGQIDDNLMSVPHPKHVKQLSNIVDIGCGLDHSIAIDNMGKVWVWGSSDILTFGEIFSHIPPFQVKVDKRIKKVDAGEVHNIALSEDGT